MSIECYITLFSEDIVETVPEILRGNVIDLCFWFLQTNNPSALRALTKIAK